MQILSSPVAVFDSGLGGISVLKQLVQLMPCENYLYFGDSAHAPYGVKSPEEVLALTEANIDFLIEKQAKAIVLACNTATSAAVAHLRQKYPAIPIIGIEPAIKPAILQTLHGRILVMATEMTLKEKKFTDLLDQYKDKADILLLPAPGIVNFVESGITSGPELNFYLWRLLAPYKEPKLDAIVLGCTHFPFVKDSIIKALGYSVEMFDGLAGTAKETERQLLENNLRSPASEDGHIEFFNSAADNDQQIIRLCWQLLES